VLILKADYKLSSGFHIWYLPLPQSTPFSPLPYPLCVISYQWRLLF